MRSWTSIFRGWALSCSALKGPESEYVVFVPPNSSIVLFWRRPFVELEQFALLRAKLLRK